MVHIWHNFWLYLLVLIGVDVGEEVRGEESGGGGGVVLAAQHPLRREHPFPLQKKNHAAFSL